jgi:hypothetical protein
MSKYIIRNGIPIRLEDSINFEALDYIRQEKKLSDTKQVKDTSKVKDELSEKDSKELGIRDMIAFTQQRIRSLINDEYEAIDGYTSAITEFMRNYKETNDELYNQLAMVLADIKKEEFPHVGELNKCLSLIDEEEGRLFNKGVREAKKTVEKSMAPQEQEQVEE